MKTTARKAKDAGYKSLNSLALLSGWCVSSLQKMDKTNSKRFNTVLNGAKANAKEGEE